MGPYRNITTAIQAEDILRVKFNRHNMQGNISKNVNVLHYYHHKSNCNKTSINNKNNVSAISTLLYVRPTYNIAQPITMPNYTNLVHQFGFNYDINAAKRAGFIERLKDYYTKCRLVSLFQIKGNYLLLNEIVNIYFRMYYKALVYEENSLVCIKKKIKSFVKY
jgi:hypothetical protein